MSKRRYGYPLVLVGVLATVPAACADTFFDRVYSYFLPANCQITLVNDDVDGRTFYVVPGITTQGTNEAGLRSAKVLKPGAYVRLWETDFVSTGGSVTIFVKNPKFNPKRAGSAAYVPRHLVARSTCEKAVTLFLSDLVHKRVPTNVDVQQWYSPETRKAGFHLLQRIAQQRGLF